MIHRIPTVRDLSENPHLAIVDALERILQLSSCALLAEYGDPEDVEFAEIDVAPQAYAMALVNQIFAMQSTLLRFRRTLEKQQSLTL